MEIKLITHKILVKHAEAPDDGGIYTGKHSFQGTTHHGTKTDFAPFNNIIEQPLVGPVSSPPKGSTHISTTKPNHGPTFDTIMNDITKAGGKPMLVGGFPRDHVLGKESKDKDVEIYGMHPDKIAETLRPHGSVNTVGSSFGVTKLTTPDGQDYDFSTPRRENKEGQGHKGFQVQPDPTMTPPEAAGRRDFSFNSIMQDPLSGEIHDYYGGLNDLKNKTLRATTEKYKEDPLRVLRGMQFAGRMGLDMDPQTAQMSKDIAHEYPTLSKDRVMTEWQKLAEKSTTPSKGMKVLQDTNWIQHYPELKLDEKKMKTIDSMATKLQSNPDFSPEDKNSLFFSALTHDMSFEDVASFLDKIGMPAPIRKRVMALKNGIDSPHATGSNPPDETSARNLSSHVAPEKISNLMHVLDAKHGGLSENHKGLHETAKRLGVHEKPPQALINGKILAQMGIKPGPQMGALLRDVYQAQLDGKVSSPDEAVSYIQSLQGNQHQANACLKWLAKSGMRIF
jgi:tRNA nucleotidyltransferase (CCA-adding enzyme)